LHRLSLGDFRSWPLTNWSRATRFTRCG